MSEHKLGRIAWTDHIAPRISIISVPDGRQITGPVYKDMAGVAVAHHDQIVAAVNAHDDLLAVCEWLANDMAYTAPETAADKVAGWAQHLAAVVARAKGGTP